MLAQRYTRPRSEGRNGASGVPAEVKAAFILKGTTFASWCRINGISRPYAVQCLSGTRAGAASLRLKKAILDAAGTAAGQEAE